MFNKLKDLKAMQSKAEEIKKRLDQISVKGTCSEENVQVICTGNKKIENVIIDDGLINPESKTKLQDSIIEAVNNAYKQAENVMESEMRNAAGGMF